VDLDRAREGEGMGLPRISAPMGVGNTVKVGLLLISIRRDPEHTCTVL